MIRPLLLALTVVGACFVTWKYSEHHGPGKSPFETLYFHLVPAALVTHGVGPAEHPAAGDDEQAAQEQGHAAAEPLVKLPLPGFLGLFDYNQDPHDGAHLVLYNLQVFQLAAVLLILIAFTGIPAYLRTGRGDVVTRTLAGFCHYVRDEMVLPNLGKAHGEKLLPMFLFLFFFILFMNLTGLVPFAVTATASIFVTAALALVTLGMMVGGGMLVQGPLTYWKSLVPHVPGWLWPLLFVVELIGVAVKPFALTIRLFANMTGGHMVVLSFIGLILFFGQDYGRSIGFLTAPAAVGFAIFIMIIEGFIAFVQAYVFTVLSAIFVGASLHPEH